MSAWAQNTTGGVLDIVFFLSTLSVDVLSAVDISGRFPDTHFIYLDTPLDLLDWIEGHGIDNTRVMCRGGTRSQTDHPSIHLQQPPPHARACVRSHPFTSLQVVQTTTLFAAFQSGVVAGRISKTKIVGAVSGLPLRNLNLWVNAYKLGFRHACPAPECTSLDQFTYGFGRGDGADRAALDIARLGADVVQGIAGPAGK